MAESDLHAVLTLQDLDNLDSFPVRTITLRAPDWSTKVGRGTYSGAENLTPAANNTWFESRVMSRDHAVLTVEPASRVVNITDHGSMHGTFIRGRKLGKGETGILTMNDEITFGANVTRGANCFTSVKLKISMKWSDEDNAEPSTVRSNLKSHNSFSADYTSDEEVIEVESIIDDESDDDASVQEVFPQRRLSSVPDSDVSDSPSYISDADVAEEDSPESSLLAEDAEVGQVTADAQNKDTGKGRAQSPDLWVYEPQQSNTSDLEHDQPSAQPPQGAELPDYWLGATAYTRSFPVDNHYLDPESFSQGHSDFGDAYISTANKENEHTMPVQLPALESSWELAPPYPRRQNLGARAPSPSDAAMMRPSVLSSTPTYEETPAVEPVASQPVLKSVANYGTRLTSAWAGHNSVLYDPLPTHLSYDQPNTTWDTAKMFTMIASNNKADDVTESRRSHDSTHVAVAPKSTSTSPAYHVERLTAPSPASVAEPVGNKSGIKGIKAGVKRKADDENIADTIEPQSIAIETSSIASPQLAPAYHTNDDGQQLHTTAATADPLIVSSSSSKVAERPRKKVKRNGSNESKASSTFMKYAATAVVSAVVASVGTVMGLAALPHDYFV